MAVFLPARPWAQALQRAAGEQTALLHTVSRALGPSLRHSTVWEFTFAYVTD